MIVPLCCNETVAAVASKTEPLVARAEVNFVNRHYASISQRRWAATLVIVAKPVFDRAR
jgi:hypothetical protein